MGFKGIVAGGVAAAWCAAAAVAAAQKAPQAPRRPAVPKAPANAAAAVPAPGAAPAEAEAPEAIEFFETHVRPVLAEKCYSCHGPKIQQAGLRLDSRAAVLKGTDLGQPVLVPGDPGKSSLVQVLHFTGKVKMPPAGKLPDKD